jgi:hypothetical protein
MLLEQAVRSQSVRPEGPPGFTDSPEGDVEMLPLDSS